LPYTDLGLAPRDWHFSLMLFKTCGCVRTYSPPDVELPWLLTWLGKMPRYSTKAGPVVFFKTVTCLWYVGSLCNCDRYCCTVITSSPVAAFQREQHLRSLQCFSSHRTGCCERATGVTYFFCSDMSDCGLTSMHHGRLWIADSHYVSPGPNSLFDRPKNKHLIFHRPEQRAQPMFSRATITLGIGPHYGFL